MDIFELSIIQSYSIVIATIIGLVRFHKIVKSYRPFIFICLLALTNEIFSTFAAYSFKSNAVNANIYVLIETVLFVWLFKNWGAFQRRSWHYPFILFLFILIWIYDNLIWNNLNSFNSLFRICYSFCLIFLAIDQVNKLLVSVRVNLLKDSRFLICMGILIFYSYKATIEVFYLFKLNFSDSF